MNFIMKIETLTVQVGISQPLTINLKYNKEKIHFTA